MSGPAFRSFLLMALVFAAVGLERAASAQPAGPDLIVENERLRTELENARQELEAARRRIAELEAEVASLKRQIERPAGDEAPPKEITLDETDPAASPRALFKAIVASYREATDGLPLGEAGDRDRQLYLRTLRQWRTAVNRQHRLPIEWHVRVTDAEEQRGRTHSLTLLAVDPKSGAELGDSFQVILTSTLARRYDQLRARSEFEVLVLRGSLGPSVDINEDRSEAGVFNRPRFIGPFAEFSLNVEPRSLTRVEDEGEAQP